ncbi:MAG: isoprenoid biosynthesis glyoxalase ElbB [Planctomycetota bacterium]|jgi:enhancing lycopene biosynthesis protein 2
MKKAKVGVILCGSGRFDGSEIHESVLTLLHLSRAGAKIHCFAPDSPQFATCEHFEGGPTDEAPRNMLQEAARIARGEVQPLPTADPEQLDAVILPGGNGAASNLCTFATEGGGGTVEPDLQRLLTSMANSGKPIGAICIAPAIVGLALRDRGLTMTLGDQSCQGASEEAAKTGNSYVPCGVEDIIVDEAHKVVTTPAYMLGPDIAAVDQGIGKLVQKVLGWVAPR